MSIHQSAIIDRQAEIDSNVAIGANCVIDAGVRIRSGCRLYHNVYVTGWTEIGSDCELHPGVIVGHIPQDTKYTGAKSYCRIGRGTVLREYVTVHRGTVPESETVVGEECFLLGGSHVGHNCTVADRVTLINHVLLGGHVQVGPRVTMGGAAAVHQFVRVGELAMIAAVGRVVMDVPPFALTEPTGRIAGLNRVGMRRAGMSREEMDDVRNAYRILLGRETFFRAAVERLGGEVKTPAGRRLLAFLQQESKRGVAGSSRRGQDRTAPEA